MFLCLFLFVLSVAVNLFVPVIASVVVCFVKRGCHCCSLVVVGRFKAVAGVVFVVCCFKEVAVVVLVVVFKVVASVVSVVFVCCF